VGEPGSGVQAVGASLRRGRLDPGGAAGGARPAQPCPAPRSAGAPGWIAGPAGPAVNSGRQRSDDGQEKGPRQGP
jgi:hypothetical protein